MKNRINEVKKFINDEIEIQNNNAYIVKDKNELIVLPMTSNDNIHLQMSGWCITLHNNGKWTWEDTTGG